METTWILKIELAGPLAKIIALYAQEERWFQLREITKLPSSQQQPANIWGGTVESFASHWEVRRLQKVVDGGVQEAWGKPDHPEQTHNLQEDWLWGWFILRSRSELNLPKGCRHYSSAPQQLEDLREEQAEFWEFGGFAREIFIIQVQSKSFEWGEFQIIAEVFGSNLKGYGEPEKWDRIGPGSAAGTIQ